MDNNRVLSLRPVLPDDEAFLCHVYAGTRREEVAAWGWDLATQDAFLKMQFTAQRRGYEAAYPGADQSIVLLGDRPVGRIIVDRTEQAIHLVDIALLPEYRNAGCGTALIESLLSEAATAGLPVRLQVLKENRAMRLYQRLGFATSGDSGLYLQMEWRPGAPQENARERASDELAAGQ